MKKMEKENQIPRRAKMYEWCPAELAIHNAMNEVEKMPADVRLTNAIKLLSEAQNAVADYIDRDDEKDRDLHFYKCPECGRIAATHKDSPGWLISEITAQNIHWHTKYHIPCRVPYIEITKEEFFKLSEDPNTPFTSEPIRPSI